MKERTMKKRNGQRERMHWERAIATTVGDKDTSREIVPSPKAKVKARAKKEETGGSQIGITMQENRAERVTKKAKERTKEEKRIRKGHDRKRAEDRMLEMWMGTF